MHQVIQPNILYFGTPVVLISTLNEDDTPNLAPMSSAWWLSQSCMLGLSKFSKTVANLYRTGECVLNLPSVDLVDAVDRLALLTGSNPVPEYKAKRGYVYEPNKFEVAQLTPISSDLVKVPRVLECPVQLEARVEHIRPFAGGENEIVGKFLVSIEVTILRVHVDEAILVDNHPNYIDPDKWQPLIMNFCKFYGLTEQVHPSRLAEIYKPQPAIGD